MKEATFFLKLELTFATKWFVFHSRWICQIPGNSDLTRYMLQKYYVERLFKVYCFFTNKTNLFYIVVNWWLITKNPVNFTYHNSVCQKYKNYASSPLSHIYTQNLSKIFSTHLSQLESQQLRLAHPTATLVKVAVVVECH